MAGDLGRAVEILEQNGRGKTRLAQRLRSETRLLSPGYRLPITGSRAAGPGGPTAGESLRVLHLLTNSLPHTQSGYSVRSHNILRNLRDHGIQSLALTRTGYPVMIGKPWCADDDTIDGIRYRRTLPAVLGATPEARLLQQVREAVQIVEDFRPHVLHATTDYRNALVAQAVSRKTGIPWILEVRGLMEKTWIASHATAAAQQRAAGSEKVRLIEVTETDLAQEASAVVTLSRTMADELERRGVPSQKITLVPNGIDPELFEENLTPAEARAWLGADLPADALVVGAVSALVDYEGFDVLLHAVARILDDDDVSSSVRDRLRIALIGDGTAAPSLTRSAQELGLEDRLLMPGRVPQQTARHWV
ncbi:MAG: glycosyltransferase, partial [Actinomycetales bacterium]|nr:glycosyltransferase [Actinomycetales bacterium]